MKEPEGAELVATCQNHEPVVHSTLAESESMREILYLLSTPANAADLLASIAELDADRGVERHLTMSDSNS